MIGRLAALLLTVWAGSALAQGLPSGGHGSRIAGASTLITSAPPNAAAVTISGRVINPVSSGNINGVTVTVYKNAGTLVCSGVTDVTGSWSCAATGLINGDVIYADGLLDVLSTSQTAQISGTSELLLVNATDALLLADGISFLQILE